MGVGVWHPVVDGTQMLSVGKGDGDGEAVGRTGGGVQKAVGELGMRCTGRSRGYSEARMSTMSRTAMRRTVLLFMKPTLKKT